MKKEKEKTGEIEMSRKMQERSDEIDNLTYQYLTDMLELGGDEAEIKFPWNIEIIREAFDSAVSVLEQHGYNVCDPYISTPENGRPYRCTLSDCGCESCGCQNEFMEKERILSGIEDAAALGGLKILDGDDDSVIVRESRTDMDFEIRVSRLAG